MHAHAHACVKRSLVSNSNFYSASFKLNSVINTRHYSSVKSLNENKPSLDSINNKQLGQYLAGLIEGDGHIFTPSNVSLGKPGVPNIEITFDIRDLPLFTKIKDGLVGGYINIRSNGQSGRLIIKKTGDFN